VRPTSTSRCFHPPIGTVLPLRAHPRPLGSAETGKRGLPTTAEPRNTSFSRPWGHPWPPTGTRQPGTLWPGTCPGRPCRSPTLDLCLPGEPLLSGGGRLLADQDPRFVLNPGFGRWGPSRRGRKPGHLPGRRSGRGTRPPAFHRVFHRRGPQRGRSASLRTPLWAPAQERRPDRLPWATGRNVWTPRPSRPTRSGSPNGPARRALPVTINQPLPAPAARWPCPPRPLTGPTRAGGRR